ncbi:MAG: 2-oxoglutarate dehydrogenase complex dihydrolipoyllysine-residue succinyltransferase [Gammaproteobacteria bacterium]|nr:2-oxoglutarate dehydrogenase complex dihydrolipoyllysine-residue succinyltransferase [Gammaproteobacteria bacterium]
MTTEVKAPGFPESVSDGLITEWHKKVGETVKRNEVLVDIETDKVVFEVPAPCSGVLTEILTDDGSTVLSGDVLAKIDETATASDTTEEPAAEQTSADSDRGEVIVSPSAQKLINENKLDVATITGSGKDGRILKEDVMAQLQQETPATSVPATPATEVAATPSPQVTGERVEKRVPMTRLRARVAERLLDAQHNAAILTTFNEINMQPIMDLRARYKDRIEKETGVRLGFMSFFVKAAVEALKKFPAVNASIDGNDIVYHGFFDVGVAIGSPRGLVVPILRDVDAMTMITVESAIADYAAQAKKGTLAIEDITGGTFTITNGGVFGSLLSTPILNPPQSAILGMHKIQERPMVENGEIVIRPMMYLALSYDHRMIDGRAAVQFLVAIKESLEDPASMLLGM